MRNYWMFVAAGFCFILGGCAPARPAKFDVYGTNMARTSADAGAVGTAITQTELKLAKRIYHADGSWACPSYRCGAQTWSSGNSASPSRREVVRAETSFDDADGKTIKIEVIGATGESTLVFVTYDKPDGPMMVLNELRQAIKAGGIKLD